jgi:hypothetical protein
MLPLVALIMKERQTSALAKKTYQLIEMVTELCCDCILAIRELVGFYTVGTVRYKLLSETT